MEQGELLEWIGRVYITMDTDKHEVLPQQHQLMLKSNRWGDDKSARKVNADLQNTKMKQDYMGKMLPWELAKNLIVAQIIFTCAGSKTWWCGLSQTTTLTMDICSFSLEDSLRIRTRISLNNETIALTLATKTFAWPNKCFCYYSYYYHSHYRYYM